jgi:hypothetical protein
MDWTSDNNVYTESLTLTSGLHIIRLGDPNEGENDSNVTITISTKVAAPKGTIIISSLKCIKGFHPDLGLSQLGDAKEWGETLVAVMSKIESAAGVRYNKLVELDNTAGIDIIEGVETLRDPSKLFDKHNVANTTTIAKLDMSHSNISISKNSYK